MIFRGTNIFDLNYEFSSEEYGILHTTKENLPVKGIIVRIASLFKAIYYLLKGRRLNPQVIEQECILFFALNQNEKSVFEKIINLDSPAHIIGDDNYSNGFPLLKIHLLSLLFIPVVLFHWVRTKHNVKKLSFLYAFDSYCLSFAAVLVLPLYFHKLKPKKIFISNHTRPFHRIIMELFENKCLGYIQHASFIDRMPALSGFSSLLVDGTDSLLKLIKAGSTGNSIYNIGNSKYDEFLNYKKAKGPIASIGVCVNNLDKLKDIYTLIMFLKQKLPLVTVFLRPHPSDPRFMEMMNFSSSNGLEFSNSREYTSLEFLKNIDILLAGDSNVHLESLYLNIPSIYINLHNSLEDWYGFLKKKIVFNGKSLDDIMDIILNMNMCDSNFRDAGKYFNGAIGSVYQGKSAMLVKEIINDNYELLNNAFNQSLGVNSIYELNE